MRIYNLFNIRVTGFYKVKETQHNTIYEVSFIAEPVINYDKELEEVTCGLKQIFYFTFNPDADALDTMILSNTSYADVEAEDKDMWYDYRILYSDDDMLRTFEKILFALKVFRDTISMFEEETDFINAIHSEYIYGDMLEGNIYMTYLLNQFSLEAKDI